MLLTSWFIYIELTHSRNYVNKSEAISKDLVQVNGNNFTLRADDQNVPGPTARGRDSVRITSQKSYTTHVSMYAAVIDLDRKEN